MMKYRLKQVIDFNTSSILRLVIVVGLLVLFVLPAQAISEAKITLQRSGLFSVKVLLDSPELVNAYDIELSYDPELVEIEGIMMKDSVASVQPMPARALDGKIIIKGGGTTPFSGNNGFIAELRLRPVAQGQMLLSVERADVYRADGAGTKIAAMLTSMPIAISRGSLESYASTGGDAKDVAPPVIAAAVIEENPVQYGKQMVIFSAEDSETGIARYEAREREWITWSEWRHATMPYPIEDGVWAVQLKAIDYADNYALATVYEFRGALKKIGGLAVLLIFVAYLFIRNVRARRAVYLKSAG